MMVIVHILIMNKINYESGYHFKLKSNIKY